MCMCARVRYVCVCVHVCMYVMCVRVCMSVCVHSLPFYWFFCQCLVTINVAVIPVDFRPTFVFQDVSSSSPLAVTRELAKAPWRRKDLLWLTVPGHTPTRQGKCSNGSLGEPSHHFHRQGKQGVMDTPVQIVFPLYSAQGPSPQEWCYCLHLGFPDRLEIISQGMSWDWSNLESPSQVCQ